MGKGNSGASRGATQRWRKLPCAVSDTIEMIAANCSFAGAKSLAIKLEGGFTAHDTGGTQGMSRMRRLWNGR